MTVMALPALMDITKITKITGDYNHARPYFFVDKVIGGVNFCLGLTKEDHAYVPSSALLEDIKSNRYSFASSCNSGKKVDDEKYATVKHVAKGLNLNNLKLTNEINNMIDLTKYVYKGK